MEGVYQELMNKKLDSYDDSEEVVMASRNFAQRIGQ